MALIVHKYGGTSVGTPEKIKNVAKRLARLKNDGNDLVVVVSAMGHTTDELIELMNKVSHSPDHREYDMLVSTGEQISAALLSMALLDIGCPAISLTGGQAGIITEDIYKKARITGIKLDRIKREVKDGKIVVITGFQGIDSKGDIITIGRGGSDTSAVAVAAALKADICEIYTDVDGVYSTDPRVVKNARKLKSISYDEMLELASLGAQVLHPRSVECARVHGVVIHLRSSINTDVEGTLIKEAGKMENNEVVTGIALDSDTAKIGVLGIPDKPGVASKIFNELAGEHINVDMIVQSVHSKGEKADIAFTVKKDESKKAVEVAGSVAGDLGAQEVVSDPNVAKVSLVGVGMVSKPGVASAMFDVLAKEKINIEMISTSEIKISCIIKADLGKKAVQILHDKFALSKK